MKKPRVLILYDFPIKGGGSGVYVKFLALRLNEVLKYDVAVAAPDTGAFDKSVQFFPLKLSQIPTFISRPGLEKQKRYSQLTALEVANLYHEYLRETIKVVETYKPDIIHVHHAMLGSWTARFIRSFYGIKFLVTSHGSCIEATSKDRRYFRMTRDALRAANAITVVSLDTRGKMFKMYGKDLAPKTRVIPGGIRISSFPEKKNRTELLNEFRKYKLGDDKIVLFTGRLIAEKGVEYLIKAAGRINGQVIIAGDGPQKKMLSELVKKSNLKNVILTGYLDHESIINLYYLADVFVSPAVWDDPMPLTVIEAMAAKLPVVVTRKGGIITAVKDNVNGLFVRPRNPSDIAEKVNLLLENSSLRKTMGEAGRSTVMQKFTWTKIAERFDKLYIDMLSK